jgi:hypothetical protein
MTGRYILAAIAALLLGACASVSEAPFAQTRPVLIEKPADFPLNGAVEVASVTDMKTVYAMYASAITPEQFDSSLRQSLVVEGLLAEDSSSARYKLTPAFISSDASGMMDKNGTLVMRYVLTRTADGAAVFEQIVESTFTSSISAATVLRSGVVAATVGATGAPSYAASEAGRAVGEQEQRRLQIAGDEDPEFATIDQGPFDGMERQVNAYRRAAALNIKRAMRDLVEAAGRF